MSHYSASDMSYKPYGSHSDVSPAWKPIPSKTTSEDPSVDPFLVGVIDDAESEDGASGRVPEDPKVALEMGIWRSIFCYGLFIHTAALAVTVGITQMSFRQQYWADEGHWKPKWFLFGLNANATMNVLQFAAKIHEILIVASLSLMVMHVMRRMLIGRGIPLGLLSYAYQVGSAEYFFSKPYGSPLFWSIRHRNGRMFFLALIVGLTVIFANMIGPSSAIAMIPNLDWYSISMPFQGQPITTYITSPRNEVYPALLEGTYDDCGDVLINGTVRGFACPSGGHATLFDWALASAEEDINFQTNMMEPFGGTRRILSGTALSNTTTNTTLGIAATHSSAITAMIGTFWHYIQLHHIDPAAGSARPRFHIDKGPVYSPLVQVECNAYLNVTARDDGENLYFKYDTMRMFESSPVQNREPLVVPPSLWNTTTNRTMDSIQLAWVNASDMNPERGKTPYRGSIGVLVTLPVVLVYDDGSENEQDSYLVACTVDARWAATELSFDPNTDTLVTNNLTAGDASFDFLTKADRDMGTDGKLKYGVSDIIQISQDWISLLDTPEVSQSEGQENSTDTTAIASLFSAYLSIDNGSATFIPPKQNNTAGEKDDGLGLYFKAVSESTATILAMSIADGMSRSNYFSLGIGVSNGTRDEDGDPTFQFLFNQAASWDPQATVVSASSLDNITSFTYLVERYGYGYGLQNRTTQFGVTILLTHAGLLAIYLFYLAIFRVLQRGWLSEAWGDLGELMSLALLSRPPVVLQHTGAGIDLSRTWRYGVRVREKIGDPDSLEMLVGRHGELFRKNERGLGVQKGKRYS